MTIFSDNTHNVWLHLQILFNDVFLILSYAQSLYKQASTISTGPPAICSRRASDMQLLLARTGHKVFFWFFSPNHVLYVGHYVGFKNLGQWFFRASNFFSGQ